MYTYAMAPDSSTLQSLVDVPLGSGGPQVVGGAFTGSHQQGVTYAYHTVSVGASGTLVIDMASNASDDSLNGLQVIQSGAGDPIGNSYCGPANLNSSGQPGVIAAFGSHVAATNFVRLDATQLATGQFGMFLNSMTPGSVIPPGSQGNLCLSGAIGRYNSSIMNSGAGGEFSLQLDLTDTPTPGGPVAIQAGETWYFQAWFRDNKPGATSNFTDGVGITFM